MADVGGAGFDGDGLIPNLVVSLVVVLDRPANTGREPDTAAVEGDSQFNIKYQ